MPTDRASLLALLQVPPRSRHREAASAAPDTDPWARFDLLLDDALRSPPGTDFESRVRALHGMKLLLEERYGPRCVEASSHADLMEELRQLPEEILVEALTGKGRHARIIELRERAKAAGL